VTRKIKLSYNYKIWLEHDKKPLLGKGRYELLKNINMTNSLKKSAELVGISNKTAYNYIKKMENKLGEKLIISHKGGKDAGGYTKLNSTGLELIEKYEEALLEIK
jgi:molybdate transport repressor ModE-like protein